MTIKVEEVCAPLGRNTRPHDQRFVVTGRLHHTLTFDENDADRTAKTLAEKEGLTFLFDRKTGRVVNYIREDSE